MRCLLMTIGSHGDVHPFVGIARALRSRGHDVAIATNDYFREMIERAGIEFVEMGSREEFTRWLGDPDVWHPQKGPGRVMAGVGEVLRRVYDVAAEHGPRRDLTLGSSLCIAGVVAAEKLGFRYATAHLAPICVRSRIELPTMPGGLNFSRMPMWFKRGFWDGADKWFIDPAIAPSVNRLRAELSMHPVTRILDGYWNAPGLTIGLWPAWYARKCEDHPGQLRLTGFPLYDEADVTPITPELDAWLRAGEKPIAFTPGSAMKFGHAFFASAAEACRRLGRRGLLLTRHAEQVPTTLPEGVRHEAYAPFGELLPRVAAMCHHGGIGSTAQCLRAGVPQLIMPMSHDQPDNAARCAKLGVARVVSRRGFKARRVARLLGELLSDPQTAPACRAVAERFVGASPLEEVCDLLEQHAGLAVA